jgi:hypothetical protein
LRDRNSDRVGMFRVSFIVLRGLDGVIENKALIRSLGLQFRSNCDLMRS